MMKKKRGFTLIELLVVVAVIMLLLSILIPVMIAAREQAYRVVCASRERNILLGLTVYATNNNYNLPENRASVAPNGTLSPGCYSISPIWIGHCYAVQIFRNMGRDVSEYEEKPFDIQMYQYFLCPSNNFQRRNLGWFCNAWDEVPKIYWLYNTGYLFLVGADWPIYGKDGLPDPVKKFVGRIDISRTSEAELVVDFTYEPKEGEFGITTHLNPSCTSHLYNGSKPAGGNVGFVDGHVEWRKFSEMCRRFKGGGWFWW